ncbi:MAG: glycerol-3-phosphate acyltransferase [Chloroflexota bacterium]|nr:glycerol-3-phosphate acyltransferase [Chloroflexota bacterium]
MRTEGVFLLSYLLGAIPFAYIFARLAGGVDIRMVGDGNVGTRNVWRSVGPLPGIATLLADVGKGYLAILLARQYQLSQMAILAAGFMAVMSHDWTIFLRFWGGQGMAASVGVLLALLPQETFIALAVAGMLWYLLRHFEFACSVGLGLLPFLAWRFGEPPQLVFYPVGLLPTIGLKKLIDLPRARKIEKQGESIRA